LSAAITKASLKRWRADPSAFIEHCLIDPETGKPFVLLEAEHQFLAYAFRTDDDGRLLYHEQVYACPKKSRKTTFAAIHTIKLADPASTRVDRTRRQPGPAGCGRDDQRTKPLRYPIAAHWRLGRGHRIEVAYRGLRIADTVVLIDLHHLPAGPLYHLPQLALLIGGGLLGRTNSQIDGSALHGRGMGAGQDCSNFGGAEKDRGPGRTRSLVSRMQSEARRRSLTNDAVLLNGVYPDDSCQVLWEDGDRVFRRGWRLGDDGSRSAVLVVTKRLAARVLEHQRLPRSTRRHQSSIASPTNTD
jgi:hypothetical protein